MKSFNFNQSDEEEDNAEFCLINPNLLDLDLEDSDSVSNTTVVSTIIDNLILPNEKLCEICSQFNERQQHLFNFVMHMQYALHCKLSEKNNELLPKQFQTKWRCWRWKTFFKPGSNWILKTVLEISKPEPWSVICSCDCIYWKSCYSYQWYYIAFCILPPC